VFKLLGPTLVPFLHGLFVFQASIRELYEKVCAMTGVPQEKAHIWDYFDKRKNGLLDPLSYKSLEESSLHMDQDVSI
jgi:ubiquitin carboxyl-terminal hydrolase 4/11/15